MFCLNDWAASVTDSDTVYLYREITRALLSVKGVLFIMKQKGAGVEAQERSRTKLQPSKILEALWRWEIPI